EAAGAAASAATALEPPADQPEPKPEADPLDGDALVRRRGRFRRRLTVARYVWPHKRQLGVVLLTMAMTTLLTIAQPWPMKVLVDNVIGHTPAPAFLQHMADSLPGPGGREALLVLVVTATVVIFLLHTFA